MHPTRTCGSLWQRVRHGVRRLFARADWDAAAGAEWPKRIMHAEMTDDFHQKQGRSTGRWMLDNGGRELTVYLKRHYRLSLWQRLLATLWPSGDWSPALQERANLKTARGLGIPVPAVVAAGEFIGPYGRFQSFLAVEELTGMLALHHAIPLAARRLDDAAFLRWKAGLTREVARLTRILHERCYFHKDLYLCHFFIPQTDTWKSPEDWHGRVHLIDLQRLARHRFTWPWWLVKDLGQLLYSTNVEGIDSRDRVRFWHAFLGPLRRTWGAHFIRRCILLKYRRYRDHNAKSKAKRKQAA